MELSIHHNGEDFIITATLVVYELGDPENSITMMDSINVPKAQCRTEQETTLVCQGAASHLSQKLVNQMRRPMMHSLREAMVSGIRATMAEGHGEATGSAADAAPATPIAEGVVPASPEGLRTTASNCSACETLGIDHQGHCDEEGSLSKPCAHDLIFASPDGALFGRCVGCEKAEIPVVGYGQSALRPEGFLTRIRGR